MSESSPPKRPRQYEGDDPFNFQSMIDELIKEGKRTDAAIDKIADNFRSRLELNIPSPEYRKMAESFLNMRLQERGKADSPTIPTASPPKRKSAFYNNASPLEQVPTTDTCSSSGTEPSSDQPVRETHATNFVSSREEPVSSSRHGRSPIRDGQEASNRGRSPARSSNANPPRSHRSRTPVDRWTRRGNASQTPPTANRRRRSRSRSFRLFGRTLGLNYETLSGDEGPTEQEPSVYHDTHMTMDSFNASGTPTTKCQRHSQHSDVKSPPTTGRRPPLDPNASVGGEVSTGPTPNAPFPSPTPTPATAQRSPGAPTIGVETGTSDLSGNFADLNVDDLQFNIGTSPTKSAKSPSKRSRRSRQRSLTNRESPNMASPQAEMSNQSVKTPEDFSVNDYDMFSPWSEATASNTPRTQDSPRGRRLSRSNARTRSMQKTKTPASGKEANGKSRQDRSQSPYGKHYFFGSSNTQTESNTETQATQPSIHTQTHAPFQSPIPPFQAPDAVFAQPTPPNDTTENVIGAQPREPMSSIPQPSFGMASAAPNTPHEFQSNGFDAPFTDETAVNKKGRNTKTPVFEPNLTIGKSNGKSSKRRGAAGRHKGSANANSTMPNILGTNLNDQGLKGAAPRVADATAQSDWIPNAFQYTSTTAFAAKSPSNASSTSAMDTDSDVSRTKGAPRPSAVDALHANIQFNMGVAGKSNKTNKTRAKRMDIKASRPQQVRPSQIDAPISHIKFSVGVGGNSPKPARGRSKKKVDRNAPTRPPEAQPQPTQPQPQPTNPMFQDVQFNIGTCGKSTTAGVGKGRPKRNGKHQRSQSVTMPTQNFPNFDDYDLARATGGPVGQRDHYVRSHSATAATMAVNQFMVQKARVSTLLEEARIHYRSKDYKSSIITNTEAIKLHRTIYQGGTGVDLLALLFSNRAAGLIMLGGAEAAVEDCSTALRLVPNRSTFAVSSSEAGPALPSKLYSRMARSYLKLGKADLAEEAFHKAISAANDMSNYCQTQQDAAQFEETKTILHQASTDATFGIGDVGRFREAMEKVSSCSRDSIRPSDRLKCKEILGHVETALGLASACDALHAQKVVNLAFLKNWRQVISHCERLAVTNAKHEICYVEDLAPRNPFAGIPAATELPSVDLEEKNESGLEEICLSSKASGEVGLRIPDSMIRYYIRALRLEEKYACAQTALENLKCFCQHKFDWLDREVDKLSRTQIERQRADQIFNKENDFQKAAEKYLSCLKIDSEGCDFEIDGSTAGGRLHAVLHCNRAACFIELKRHHQALTECTAALRIHPRYMKALSRRARCYRFLERLEESVGEYKTMLRYVEEAKKDPSSLASFPCLFDGPHQMKEDEIRRMKREYEEVCQVKSKAERTARAEADYRKEREKFRNESSKSNQDAHKRRENFFKSSSRRWDSFTDRKPKKASKASTPKRNAGNDNKSMPNTSDGHPSEGDCHYAILQLKQNATDNEIKKAYRKMALMYHPDKNKDPKATDSFRLVTEAYDTLKDAKARRQYDQNRRWKRRF